VIIAGKYEVPDHCPKDCQFIEERKSISMSSVCFRCPVFNCGKTSDGICMIDAEDFREDWAAEWEEFFKTGIFPEMEF
jgi:hypothetical protein